MSNVEFTMMYFLVVCCVLGLSSAAQINFKPYNETAMSMFLTSDTDHDACFERSELDHVFVVYDTDGSGTVSRHEYTVHITATNPELHDFAHVLYDDYDLDGDHHLEKHDYDAYFAKLDADSDGCVTPTEFVDYWTVIFIANEHLHGHGGGHGK
ncbi:uncharacterized protein LOC134694687 [Mytilus trossulus]|uniref:uncharacterized protein LOC134694687 n=1 Tax=Mytilus trossulus TaxID=6551 RepID=UPI003006A5C3